MAAPKPVAEPHKELRFTRAAQGRLFFIAGALVSGLGILLACFAFLPEAPLVPVWSPLVALPFAVLLFRVAIHCVRHAYLIFTPLGIEIFPFFRPSRGLQVIYWSQIAGADVSPDQETMTLHYDDEQRSGLVASLAPIPKERRHLVKAAIDGVMAKRLEE